MSLDLKTYPELYFFDHEARIFGILLQKEIELLIVLVISVWFLTLWEVKSSSPSSSFLQASHSAKLLILVMRFLKWIWWHSMKHCLCLQCSSNLSRGETTTLNVGGKWVRHDLAKEFWALIIFIFFLLSLFPHSACLVVVNVLLQKIGLLQLTLVLLFCAIVLTTPSLLWWVQTLINLIHQYSVWHCLIIFFKHHISEVRWSYFFDPKRKQRLQRHFFKAQNCLILVSSHPISCRK